MFDFLKRRKDSDFEDIRSGVLGPPMNEPDFPQRNRMDAFQAPEFEDVTRPPRMDDRPRFNEPPGFNTIDTRTPQADAERNYDIIDRLNMIESQLAAIRSQTETINERLKNMERLLPRRY